MINNRRGFSLLEMLITISILGVLTAVVVTMLNPAQQLAKARDTQRKANLFTIVSAVYQYTTDHSGSLPDPDGDPMINSFPTTPTCIGTSPGCFDLAASGDDDSIVPEYMVSLPFDPKTGDLSNTNYYIYSDAGGHIHASAIGEVSSDISVAQ